jgi:hypothetical protein
MRACMRHTGKCSSATVEFSGSIPVLARSQQNRNTPWYHFSISQLAAPAGDLPAIRQKTVAHADTSHFFTLQATAGLVAAAQAGDDRVSFPRLE